VVKLSELDPIDESAAKMFQMIESSVNRLDIFIQSIIEYYQNSRNLNENKEIDFEALVHDVLLNLHYYEGSEKIKFELDFHENGKFVGDEFRLRIILSNLISNAIKYRRVDLEKHIVRIVVNSSANQAAIKIEDNGVGILQEHLQNIFKMFFRADSYRSGSGIGLYIVKEALEKVGGEISVHSEINQGTQFEIKIPSVKMDSK
jgi:signal transduction histidine kinase